MTPRGKEGGPWGRTQVISHLCLICVRRGIQRGCAVCASLQPVLLGSFPGKGLVDGAWRNVDSC